MLYILKGYTYFYYLNYTGRKQIHIGNFFVEILINNSMVKWFE